MSSLEERPLLEVLDELHTPDDLDVYDRFSKAQKNFIVFAVSFAGLLPSAKKNQRYTIFPS